MREAVEQQNPAKTPKTQEKLGRLLKEQIYAIAEAQYLVQATNYNRMDRYMHHNANILRATPANAMNGYAAWVDFYQAVCGDTNSQLDYLTTELRKNAEHQEAILYAFDGKAREVLDREFAGKLFESLSKNGNCIAYHNSDHGKHTIYIQYKKVTNEHDECTVYNAGKGANEANSQIIDPNQLSELQYYQKVHNEGVVYPSITYSIEKKEVEKSIYENLN